MTGQAHDVEYEAQREIADLRAVLEIKEHLIQSLTQERNELEKRLKELGQKYMEMLRLYETLRHEMEGLPTLEEVIRMQALILQLEQQLKKIN